MSNFQKKYYYDFKSLDNKNQTVEIWQDITTTITPTKIIGAVDPFVVTLTPLENKFQPVRGTGADLNLFATSTLQFMDLYTANIQEYQVKHTIDGELNWCGYLDTELFSSDFSKQKNYTVSITANDGFALLERMNYLQSDGSNYQGLTTQWGVLQSIITKLNLPYKNIYVGLSTSIEGVPLASSETIFHKTFCNNQNWYNEDGDAETCRKVLEEILRPYAAYIIQDNANLYITDVNTTASATTVLFKKYDNSFNYISDQSVSLFLGDLSNIGFKSNNTNVSMVSGFNKQVVRYSPYINSKIIDFNAEGDFSFPLTFTTRGTYGYRWTENGYIYSKTWDKSYGVCASYQGIDESVINESDNYLKIGNITGNLSFAYKKELPLIIPTNSKLKISCKAFARTIDDIFNKSNPVETSDIYQITIKCKLKIGNRQFLSFQKFEESEDVNGVFSYSWKYYQFWADDTDSRTLDLNFQNVSSGLDKSYFSLDNKWTELKYTYDLLIKEPTDFYIPLNSGFAGGELVFEIYDWNIRNGADIKQANYSASHATSKANVKDIRLKDLQFTIVDANGKEYPNNDVEYIGYMNPNFKNTGDEITLYQGTSKSKNSIEKAAMMGYDSSTNTYYFLDNWARQGSIDCIENLLLRSIVSNYTDKTIKLNATIARLNSIIGCLKYNDYLPDKKFMVTYIKNDYANNKSEIEIQEIFQDSLSINKSF